MNMRNNKKSQIRKIQKLEKKTEFIQKITRCTANASKFQDVAEV